MARRCSASEATVYFAMLGSAAWGFEGQWLDVCERVGASLWSVARACIAVVVMGSRNMLDHDKFRRGLPRAGGLSFREQVFSGTDVL